MTEPARYDYCSLRLRKNAESELEDMFACGDIDTTDNPVIEERKGTNGRIRFYITLEEHVPDGPPSKCTGSCASKSNAEQWDDNGFCRFCGEDGNA